MNEIEARTIPKEVAICPICGKGLWIESIDEVEEGGDQLTPTEISLTCETEPEIGSSEWYRWHDGHFSNPYTDWLPLDFRVLDWLKRPEQVSRVEAIWNSGHAMLAGEGDRHVDRVMQVALNPKPGEPTAWIDGEPIYPTDWAEGGDS